MSPNATTNPSSLEIPIIGFSLRALIDFSRFWRVVPAGLPDAVDNQLRGWLEYIFFQFWNLDFSLDCKYSSALITTEVSRLPDTAHLQLPFEAAPQGGVDDSIDQSGAESGNS
jgi:hypothetical protein